MEKTNSFTTDGVADESTQMTNKWLTDACSSMMNIYDKQLKTTLGFYNNFFNSFSGADRNGQSRSNPFFPSFFSGNDFFRSSFNPMNYFRWNNGSDLLNSRYEEMASQMRDLTARLFTLYQEQIKNGQSNWNEFNNLLEEEWKATQELTNSFRDMYRKQINQSVELNKKWMDELNDQLEMATDRNKKFWADLNNQEEVAKNGKEKEPEQRDGQAKKQGRGEYAHL